MVVKTKHMVCDDEKYFDSKEKEMGSKNQVGMPYNKLEVLTDAKEHFLSLCKMYEHMGKLFKIHSKELSHPMFVRTSVPQTNGRLLDQFYEIGEEMKNIGILLDMAGGKPVMKAEESPIPIPTPEEKPDVKKAAKKKKAPKKETFVDNIAPKKGKKKK